MADINLVLVTVPDEDTALKLAGSLVEERLAACANIIPNIRSIYHWEGRIEDNSELLIIFKTKKELVSKLTKRVTELHPYDVPEVVALPIKSGFTDYLDWIQAETL